jgi:pimeloyl-ACP methyl ester carboxylesterase
MKTILYLALIYCVLLVMLTVFQRKIIYYPYTLDKDFAFPPYVPELEEVFITCDDACTINGLFAPGSKNKPAVLIFHGNAGNITHRDFLLRGFNTLGYSALLIDYHGYGKSEGTPSEKNLYRDGKAALEWLTKEKNRQPEDIVLFGKSLGSGVAVELATRHSFKGLILESAFTSIASVARSHFPYNCFPVSPAQRFQKYILPYSYGMAQRTLLLTKERVKSSLSRQTCPKNYTSLRGQTIIPCTLTVPRATGKPLQSGWKGSGKPTLSHPR